MEVARRVDRDDDAAQLERRPRDVHRAGDRLGQVDVDEDRRPARELALGEGVERPRQSHQAVGFLMQGLEHGAVGRHDPVAQRLEVTLEVRQRGAQLVRRVRDELAPEPLLFL